MSRHRNVRNLDYDAAYDDAYDDSIYGHSLDDHDCASSPTSAELYMYNNAKDNDYQFGAFFPSTNKIVEEGIDNKDESYACHRRDSSNLERSRLSSEDDDTSHEYRRRDSSNFERPRLSSEDDIKLNSVLDEIRNVVGDQYSEARLIETVLEHKFDYETSLNALLTNQLPSASNEVPIPSLTKQKVSTKRQRAIVTNPDESFNYSPFGYMIPLCYSMSGVLILEKGNFERVCVAKYIKEWQTNLKRCLKDEKEQSKAKELVRQDKIIPLSDHDKQVLSNMHRLAIDRKPQINTESNLSYSSNDQQEVILSPNLDVKPNNSIQQVIGFNIPQLPESPSVPPGFKIQSTKIPITGCPNSSLDSNLMMLDSKQLKESNISVQTSSQSTSLSALASAHFSNSSVASCITSNSVFNNVSQIPVLKKFDTDHVSTSDMKFGLKTNPTEPALNILNSNPTIPTLNRLSMNSTIPGFNRLGSSPTIPTLNRPGNSPTIPALNRPDTSPTIPALNRPGTSPTIPALNRPGTSPTIPALNRPGTSPTVPTLNRLGTSPTRSCTGAAVSYSSQSIPILGSNIKSFEYVGSGSPFEISPFLHFSPKLSANIDLNLALNKNKFSELLTQSMQGITNETCDVEIDGNNGNLEEIEFIPELSPDLKKKMLLLPSTEFAVVMLQVKKHLNKKSLMSQTVQLRFSPFAFDIPSPDDLVRTSLSKY